GSWDAPSATGVEIALLPGVTDSAAPAVVRAARQLGAPVTAAATGRRVEFGPTVPSDRALTLAERRVDNPVIERGEWGTIEAAFAEAARGSRRAEVIPIAGLAPDELAALCTERALALD